MKEYQKKEKLVVKAMQFWENCEEGWPPALYTSGGLHYVDYCSIPVVVKEGDWVVLIDGQSIPCPDDIFKFMYEPVPEKVMG